MLLYRKGLVHLLLILLPALASSIRAQVIWYEPFNYPDMTITGANNNTANPALDWTSSCPTCISGDWYWVQNNEMEGHDTNGPASLETETIDISAYPIGVEVSFDLSESGPMEGCPGGNSPGCNNVDWIRIEYRVDAGPWQDASSPFGGPCTGACAGATYVTLGDFNAFTFTICPLIGDSIRLRVTTQNWAANEYLRIDNITVQVQTCNPFVLNHTVNHVSCFGASDGTINVNVSGAQPPYTYSLNGGPFQSQSTFSGLGPGNYTVVIQDSNGALDTISGIQLTQPTAISFTDSIVPIACTGVNSGEIWALNASGGSPGYTYSLNGGPFQSTNSFSGLAPGMYQLIVMDMAGCRDTVSGLVLSYPPPITAFDSIVGISCAGDANGEVWITNVLGGSPGFTFSLNGGPFQSAGSFTNLGPGNYTLITQDSLGCEDTLAGIVLQDPPLLSLSTTATSTGCTAPIGSVTANVSGGTPGYSYLWNTNPPQTTATLIGLNAGTYAVVVTDSNGCTATDTATVSQPVPPQLTANPGLSSCTNSGPVQLGAAISGGNSPYAWAWSCNAPSCQLDSLADDDPLANPPVTTTYFVQVTDSGGCISNLDSMVVAVNPSPVADAGSDATTCPGDTAQLQGNASGAGPLYDYDWSPAATLDNPSIPNPIATPSAPTWYVLTVTSGGCSGTDSVFVDFQPQPLALAGMDTVICRGQSIWLVGSEIGSPNAGHTYLWLLGQDTVNLDGNDSVNVAPTATSTYALIVDEDPGCRSEPDSLTVMVEQPFVHGVPEPEIEFCPGEPLRIGVAAEAGYTYGWNPKVGLQDPDQPLTMIAPEESGSYQLMVVNDTMQTEACRTQFFPVNLLAGDCLLPNVVTPNGDGTNDALNFGPYFHDITLTVYDRWGKLVFRANGYQNDWEGTNAQGQPLPVGVYYFVLEANVLAGTSAETHGRRSKRAGEFTLLR